MVPADSSHKPPSRSRGNTLHIDVNPLPLVSIITPSFNQGRFIRDTIESVLSQGYPRLEYLVMDGGSTDETVEILRSYGDRLIWRSAPDGGQADAVNTGVRLAKGEIIGWLNSDDTYQPGAIKAAVDYLIAYPETAVVYGDAHYIDERGEVIGTYPTEDFDLDRLAQACLICQPTAFIRRSALEANSGQVNAPVGNRKTDPIAPAGAGASAQVYPDARSAELFHGAEGHHESRQAGLRPRADAD